MPFRLSNPPSTFTRLMILVLRLYLNKFLVVYFYDILVYSNTYDEHLSHLHKLFKILQENKLSINFKKCSFSVKEIYFLGFLINEFEIFVDPNKIKAIKDWPQPRTVKKLQSFLGLTSFYRKFITNLITIASSLTKCLKKRKFAWTNSQT